MGLLKWLDSDEVKGNAKEFLRPFYRLLRNRRANMLMKIILVIVVILTIYYQVFAKENINELYGEFLVNFNAGNAWWVIVAAILMPVNWILETLKWQVLVGRVEKVPFLRAFKGVFLGVSLSVFTPNRVGEYGGRILVVKPENNWKTIVATLVSSFSQQIALFTLGILGMVFFIHFYLKTEWILSLGFGVVGIVLIIFMLVCYYNVRFSIPLFQKLPYLRRFTKHMEVLDEYTFYELSLALFYAILRYAVYSLQYYLILRFFGIHVSLFLGISGIATIFLLQTSVPLPAIADLFVRSEVALYVWGFFTNNEISILASTFGLWVLNIIVPAALGMLFIFSVNISKTMGVKSENGED